MSNATSTTTATTAASDTAATRLSTSMHEVLAERTRPSRPSAISVCRTFSWRAMLKIKHVPEQLFDVTMFPVMFTLMFTFLFGGALAGSTEAYVQFLIPGIVVQTVTMISMYTGMGVNQDIQKGVFDRFRTLPIWQPGAMVGALVADMFRYTMASIIVVLLGLLLGFRPDGGAVGVIAALALVVLFSFSLSWIWTLLGLTMRTPESVMYTSMMILFPLTFISSVFVDPSTMPSWLQTFVDANPITHLAEASRSLMGGDVDTSAVTYVLVESLLLVAVFAPLTMRRYRRER
jgi:ABC-2 type transport system permease protein